MSQKCPFPWNTQICWVSQEKDGTLLDFTLVGNWTEIYWHQKTDTPVLMLDWTTTYNNWHFI